MQGMFAHDYKASVAAGTAPGSSWLLGQMTGKPTLDGRGEAEPICHMVV